MMNTHVFTTRRGNTMSYLEDFDTAVKLASQEAKLLGDKIAKITTIKKQNTRK